MLQLVADDLEPEAAWEEGETSLRALMDQSPAIAWIKDEEGRYVYLNEPAERLFDVRLGDIRGKTDRDRFPEDDARCLRQNDQWVLATARSMRLIKEVQTPDGRVHTRVVIKFPFGEAIGRQFVGDMAVDITELQSFEARLRERLRVVHGRNIELARANDRLRELATTDGLTGLRNHRFFWEALDSAYSYAVRKARPLSLLMVDVD
jgi:PAS domain S-box-containing protein